jgi:predicted branched-subunit amino acid permease
MQRMSLLRRLLVRTVELTSRPAFRLGISDMSGILPGIGAWGLVTGVAMVKGGLTVPLALFMSFTVFAGSAQLATLPLIVSGAPMWVVWATALCVNLRFVVFSAQWRPFFLRFTWAQRLFMGYFCGDTNFVLFTRRFKEARVGEGQISYFAGSCLSNWVVWQVSSVLGIFLADGVPTQWGLGFAGVLALLGLLLTLVSDRRTAAAAAVAAGAAIAAFALPLKLNILVAITAAICAGLSMDALAAAPQPKAGAR